ncbi:hemagglutinin repeat-containing protein [Erwiniaceae bacterium CAU 1747]
MLGAAVKLTAVSGLTKSESKSSGLTLGLSGTVGSALNSAVHEVKGAKKEESGRLAALKGAQAALTGYQAVQAGQLAAAGGKGSDGSVAGLTLSYGRQKSTSEQRQEERTSSGSQLQAGRDMHIAATAGDLNVEGARLQAGRDMSLSASRDVNLTSGKNSTQSSGHNSSHGGSVGVGLSAGGVAAGLSVSASADHSRGHENGSSLSHTVTTADAGRTVTVTSGRDTLLQGAQVSGETIKAEVGHNLLIASEQDRDHYEMKQSSSSAGGSLIAGAGTGGSASVSASRDKMNSDWQSVQQQSGLFAGQGGFDVSVGQHTQLDGGVIASTAEKEKNRLETGTLGWSDIHNQADFTTQHQGVGISSGGSYGEKFIGNMANNMLAGANNSGHADSTTHAAVSGGTITIRDKDRQQQDVADLSRDTAHAENGLSPIFNKEKEQHRLQAAQLIGEIGSQAGDIAETQGDIAAWKAGKAELAAKGISEPGADATEEETARYNAALKETSGYITTRQKWGTGSAIQQGIQAATAAVQGLAGGDLKAAIAGASAPYLAEVIKQTAPDEASRVMAHAAVAGVIAAAQGNSALAGAAGAATTALMGEAIKKALYGDVAVSQLDEEQKQTLVTLGTLAAGLAGGLTGGSAGDAVAGAQAGQNEISNNMVSMGMLQQMLAQETLNSAAMAEAGKGNANDQAALALTKKVKEGLDAACLQNVSCVLMAVVEAQNQAAPDGPSHTGSNQGIVSGPSNTGGNQLSEQGEHHTGNNIGKVDVGPNNTGGNQTIDQSPSNTGNTEAVPNLPNHMTSDGYDNGAEKPSNIKVAEDKFLKNNGFDAHQIKKDFLGAKAEIKLYDIYVDKDSGQLWIFRKGGKGEGIPTGEFINK